MNVECHKITNDKRLAYIAKWQLSFMLMDIGFAENIFPYFRQIMLFLYEINIRKPELMLLIPSTINNLLDS